MNVRMRVKIDAFSPKQRRLHLVAGGFHKNRTPTRPGFSAPDNIQETAAETCARANARQD